MYACGSAGVSVCMWVSVSTSGRVGVCYVTQLSTVCRCGQCVVVCVLITDVYGRLMSVEITELTLAQQ